MSSPDAEGQFFRLQESQQPPEARLDFEWLRSRSPVDHPSGSCSSSWDIWHRICLGNRHQECQKILLPLQEGSHWSACWEEEISSKKIKSYRATWEDIQSHSQSESWATWHCQEGQCQKQWGSPQSGQFQFPLARGAQTGCQNSENRVSKFLLIFQFRTWRSSTLSSAYMSSDKLNLKLNWNRESWIQALKVQLFPGTCQVQTPSGVLPSLLKKVRPSWMIFSKSTLHLRSCRKRSDI